MNLQANLFGDDKIRWITGAAFADLVAKKESLDDVAVLKSYVADEVKSEGLVEGVRKFTFVVSTGSEDRDGDIINPNGWEFGNFLKAGGPVLFGHAGAKPPIGKSPYMGIVGKALRSSVEFHPKDIDPFGFMIGQMVEFGSLKSCSPGFRPYEYEPRGGTAKGISFNRQELLEWSIVPVPSNPEALRDMQAKGVDLTPYVAWCEEALAGVKGAGAWVAKADVEAVLKLASGNPSSVVVPASTKGTESAVPAGGPPAATLDHATADSVLKIHNPKVVKEGDEFKVVDDDGKVYGTHKTKADADAQLAALYAAKTSEAKKAFDAATLDETKHLSIEMLMAMEHSISERMGELKTAGFMGECADCGAKKPTGKECPKCGSKADAKKAACVGGHTKGEGETCSKCGAPMSAKPDGKGNRPRYQRRGGKGKKDFTPEELKYIGLDYPLAVPEPEPMTFAQVLAQRTAQEAQSKITWAFVDAIASIILYADPEEEDPAVMLQQSCEDFVQAALDARDMLEAQGKSFKGALGSPKDKPVEKSDGLAIHWAPPGDVKPNGGVLVLPSGAELEQETKRMRMHRTGKLPD